MPPHGDISTNRVVGAHACQSQGQRQRRREHGLCFCPLRLYDSSARVILFLTIGSTSQLCLLLELLRPFLRSFLSSQVATRCTHVSSSPTRRHMHVLRRSCDTKTKTTLWIIPDQDEDDHNDDDCLEGRPNRSQSQVKRD